MKYRPEIDGLRAVAVIPVLLYHADVPLFSGGYIGVDIFFVISGYLITSIILAAHEKGTFSFLGFYERRVRRIFPALFTILLCCIPLSWFFMSSGMIWDFWQSIISAPLFVSNVLFTLESGYFEVEAEIKPLIHIWSLSVEEQFYVFFPILLVTLLRFAKRKVIYVFFAICAVSLMWAHFDEYVTLSGIFTNHTILRLDSAGWASFYMPFGRAWELLAGSIVTLMIPYTRNFKNSIHWAASVLGLVFISVSIVLFDDHTDIPGLVLLMPVVGTMLVILFARVNGGAELLTNRLMVQIGLMSYSIYLWHQPVFSFCRMVTLETMSPITIFVLMMVTLFLSWLTWRFIENPFRKKEKIPRKYVGFFAIAGSVFFIGIGLFGLSETGRRIHYDFVARDIPENRINMIMDSKNENGKAKQAAGGFSNRSYSNDHRMKILLLGDSKALNWARAFNVNSTLFSDGYEFRTVGIDALCYQFIEDNKGTPLSCATAVRNLTENNLVDESDHIFLLESFEESTLRYLQDMLSFLGEYKSKLTIVASAEFTDMTKMSLDLARSSGGTDIQDARIKEKMFRHRSPSALRTHEFLRSFATEKKIDVISEYDFYCEGIECSLFSASLHPYMYDTMHVTDAGAQYLGKKIYQYLENNFALPEPAMGNSNR